MRITGENSDLHSAKETLQSHSPQFYNEIKRNLCWKGQIPKEHSLAPLPHPALFVKPEGTFPTLTFPFQACRPMLVLHRATNLGEKKIIALSLKNTNFKKASGYGEINP